MPFNNASLLDNPTVAFSAGSAITLVSQGSSERENRLYVDEDSSSVLRRYVTVKATPARVSTSAPGGYTQERSFVACTVPKVLTNGNRTTNTGRIEISVDPETTDAERTALRKLMMQMLDAQFDALYNKGNAQ